MTYGGEEVRAASYTFLRCEDYHKDTVIVKVIFKFVDWKGDRTGRRQDRAAERAHGPAGRDGLAERLRLGTGVSWPWQLPGRPW